MLSNAYFLAKFRFDTAENEPAKNLRLVCAARRTGEEVDDGGSLPVELVEPQVRLDAVERADLEITRAANNPFSFSSFFFFFFSPFFRRDALKEQFGKEPSTVRCLAVKSALLGTRPPRKEKEAALQKNWIACLPVRNDGNVPHHRR